MATISLGMIVKNEGRTLRECLKSVGPYVDQIVIGLAGESTDNTADIIAAWNQPETGESSGAPTIEAFNIEWTNDFSEARNKVLERCTGDYFLWLDGDDVLHGGDKLQHYIQTAPNVDAFYFGYDYARDENGNNVCYLVRERLVKRRRELEVDWKWVGAVHEVLSPEFPSLNSKVEDIVVIHNKPANKHEPERNLRILYEQLRRGEPNPDPRILVYLGAENAGRGNLQEAILHLQRFVKLSGWDEEKYQAQIRISNAYRALGEIDRALEAAYAAIAIMPEWPDAYLAIAKAYASEPISNWKACLEYLKIGVSKPKPQTMLIINPLEYTYEPSLLIALAYTHLGDYEIALENYKNAYGFKQDPAVLNQIQLLEHEKELNRVQQAFLFLREHLGRNDEWLKVRQLFNVVPKQIEQSPEISDAWGRTMEQTAHVDNPQIMIDFYRENPHWTPMADEQINDPQWLDYPRMRYAIEVGKRIHAKSIVDWGCSDGFISLPLARELGASVQGFDLDPRCTDLASVRAKEWGVDASFKVGNVDEVGQWEGDKADLAVFFEVIEHVVNPAETLDKLEKTANHIVMTTPYLSWEKGNIPAWDKNEPKGHLRIFDLRDIEVLLTGRGQIMNLYKEPWGNSGWIFADYKPGVKLRERIIIGAMAGLENWGPRKLKEQGLGGSETAVIKLAEAFAAGNRRPIVYSPIDEPGYYNGVCYRPVDQFRTEVRSDLYIAWRMPEAADWDINTKHLALWMHDTDYRDRLTPDRARRFDSIIVLTEWHLNYVLEKYPFIDPDKVHVIGNGVDKELFCEKVERDPKRVIYSSSPDRGLDIILDRIWPKVVEAVPDAELHVYYGWASFDKATTLLPDSANLKQFKQHMDDLFIHSKGVVQHGRIPQAQLAKEFQKSSVWLYPTYFSETYCITAIEAQLAGCIPITNRLAALNETVTSGIEIPGDVNDERVNQAYADAVIQVLNSGNDEELRSRIKNSAPAKSWDQIATEWERFLNG